MAQKKLKLTFLDQKPGVSILMSYEEKPPYVKLPIFSVFMENSAKFMKNSGLTLDLKSALGGPKPIQGPGVQCLKIEASHQINVFISVFRWIGDHIWQKHCLSFIRTFMPSPRILPFCHSEWGQFLI